jgi:phosphatidylglycerol:prolipoprotein diacylglycerol transferase
MRHGVALSGALIHATSARENEVGAVRMTFPVYLNLLGIRLHPHLVLEGLGYFVGSRVYFATRRREPEHALPLETTLWLLVGCIFGAWAGSKVLAWAESPHYYLALLQSHPAALFGGKTIVGGLLGGWGGVEFAKARLGIRHSTGDAFVVPIALGTAIGRLGCFLTGLADRTFGIATTLPWGIDFGDGVHRHPTQLYESTAVLLLACVVSGVAARRVLPDGARFRLYFIGYFTFRFFVEYIKPREMPVLNLSAIQLASLGGIVISTVSLSRLRQSESSKTQ